MSLPKEETWYEWKVLGEVDGETEKRLFTPWSDPKQYEFAFDFIFKTPELAVYGLEDFCASDDALEEGWILCKTTITPVMVWNEERATLNEENGLEECCSAI